MICYGGIQLYFKNSQDRDLIRGADREAKTEKGLDYIFVNFRASFNVTRAGKTVVLGFDGIGPSSS